MNDPRLSLTRGNTPAPQAQIAKKPSAPSNTVFSWANGTPSRIGSMETTSGSGPRSTWAASRKAACIVWWCTLTGLLLARRKG